MANISRVTGQLYTGGDLPLHQGQAAMLADLRDLQRAGVTHILDNRIEWNDADFLRRHAPGLGYRWNGQDDAGQAMPDEWFDDGVGYALDAMRDPAAAVLVHCHMGINRGPSMAFAVLLADGVSPVEALTLIRTARPVAAIAYSLDALGWWHRSDRASTARRRTELADVQRWHAEHPLDVVRVIRQVRQSERAAPNTL